MDLGRSHGRSRYPCNGNGLIMATYVEGLREVVRSLEKFGVEVADLKAVFKKIGNMVVSDATSLAPRRSGALINTIKASNTKNKSVVRAGSARVPYAGVIHYGGYNNIAPHPFLTDAVAKNKQKAVDEMNDGLADLIRKYNLK